MVSEPFLCSNNALSTQAREQTPNDKWPISVVLTHLSLSDLERALTIRHKMQKHKKIKMAMPYSRPLKRKSSFWRAICCDEGSPPSSPTSSSEKKVPDFHLQHNTARVSLKRHERHSRSSFMEVWAQKSDEAAKDVFSTMRKMFGCVNVNANTCLQRRKHSRETERLKRPASEVVSKLDSCNSFSTQYSISELGAEANPPWLLAATQKEAWLQHHSSVKTNSQTQQDIDRDMDAQNKAEMQAPWAMMCQPSHERQIAPLSHVLEQIRTGRIVNKAVIESPSYPKPRTRSSIQQEPSRTPSAPRVAMQVPILQMEQWPEKHVFNPARIPQQLEKPSPDITKPLPTPPITEPAPYPPLTALIYFALELPRSSPQQRGGYMRHYAHPMRLPLSTPQELVASIAHLRAFLTQHTSRFLSHFSSQKSQTTSDEARLVVNFPSLFCAGGYGMEKIWGPELAWAWVDTSEERFAEAMVGVLREVAEVAVKEGRGGVVDVVCVARKVVDGRRGYGLLMDVRRIEGKLRKDKRNKTRKVDQAITHKAVQSATVMVGGVEKMWIH